MQYRIMGKTGERVSALGFGCMRLPILEGKGELIDKRMAAEMFNYALDHGVNYFDTAYTYHRQAGIGMTKGKSEDFLGEFFKGARRDKVFLATKLPTFLIHEAAEFEQKLDDALRSLQTDHIDFYLAHSLMKPTWYRMVKLDMLSFLQKAKAAGKIRHIGFSFHDELPVFKEIADAFDWEFAQIQYNYLDVEKQAGTEGLRYVAAKGLGVVIMEPLRGGKLVAQPVEEIQQVWAKSEYQRTLAERGLHFVWNDPAVSIVLSGMNAPEQVKANIAAADASRSGSLSNTELALYDEVRKIYWNQIVAPCTACGYCMPCPQGVRIPDNLNVLNEIGMFGDLKLSKANYDFLKPNGTADHCVQCGECLDKCPQHIQIPDHLSDLVEKMRSV